MKTKNFLQIILYICLIGVTFADPCDNWEIKRDNKCYKVLDSQTLDFENSEKICKNLSSSATLVTIETLEEQEYLKNLLFKNLSIVENVWIGAKKNNISTPGKEFLWVDDSKMNYINWDKSNNFQAGYDCVELQWDADSQKLGKWLSVPCKKKNNAICQISNGKQVIPNGELERKFNEFQTEVKEFMTNMNKFRTTATESMQTSLNLIPVGFIYIQLPNQLEPHSLWPTLNWEDVSRIYRGSFLRILGIGSEAFGTTQNQTSPIISEIESNQNTCNSHISGLKADSWSDWIRVGGNASGNQCLRFKMSSGEVIPVNTAVRIWKRV